MKRIACLMILAVSLGGFALAQTASRTVPVLVPVLVEVIGADMSHLCREDHAARARKVLEACDGKQQCSFTPEVGDAASEACARDSAVLWRCGETGETRSMALARAPGQSREIRMECRQPVLAAAPPPAPAEGPPSVVASPLGQETITVTVTTPRPTEPRAQPTVRGSEAQVESEVATIQNYMVRLEPDPSREPSRDSGTGQDVGRLRADRDQPARGPAAPLLPTDRGQSASALAPMPPARIRLVQATWGGNCRQNEGNETNRLISACNGKAQCVFTVAARGEGEAADACARDYRMVWACGGDSRMHAATLSPARGQSREITLVCPE